MNHDAVDFAILHEDENLVAIDKPAGLLVHRSKIARDARAFAVQLVRERVGGPVFPVHRLDRGTSGVLLFGKSAQAASRLALVWQSEQVVKQYIAVVRGWTDDEGLVDYALKPRAAFRSQKCRIAGKEAQAARTAYRRLARVETDTPVGRYDTARYSLLALYPETGRKHQIRRHMKHIFHPILGDTSYGDGRHNRHLRERHGMDRLMLMLQTLRFPHPASGEGLCIEAKPDAAFRRLAGSFGWRRALLNGHDNADENAS